MVRCSIVEWLKRRCWTMSRDWTLKSDVSFKSFNVISFFIDPTRIYIWNSTFNSEHNVFQDGHPTQHLFTSAWWQMTIHYTTKMALQWTQQRYKNDTAMNTTYKSAQTKKNAQTICENWPCRWDRIWFWFHMQNICVVNYGLEKIGGVGSWVCV